MTRSIQIARARTWLRRRFERIERIIGIQGVDSKEQAERLGELTGYTILVGGAVAFGVLYTLSLVKLW